MTRLKLKLYPFHTFLFIPFIVLFLFSHNLGQTKMYMTYRTLWAGGLLTLGMFGAFYLLFRSRLKSGVVVTFILFTLFQYGVVYEFFETLYYQGKWPLKNIHRYLVAAYGVVYIGIIWKTWRTGHDFIKINYFLNTLILLLLVFNFVTISFTHLANTVPDSVSKNGNNEELRLDFTRPKPDIYYIILDGYASNAVLKKYFNFENREFTAALEKQDFRFCDSAFANYYYTSSSLAATLNFQYRDSLTSDVDKIRDNRLFSTLKKNGYAIWHLKSGYAVTSYFRLADKTVIINGPNEFEKSLFKYTVLRLDDLLGLFAHQRLSSQFERVGEMAVKSSDPRFCFVHIVAPHPPYVFDRNGNMRTKHQFAEHSWEPKELYIDQLIYVNNQILKFINQVVATNPQAVILLQSDHGPWIKASSREEVFEARSQVLYAFRSGKNFSPPASTSPVNTFRYLLNGLFSANLDTLQDVPHGKKSLMQDPILVKKADAQQ